MGQRAAQVVGIAGLHPDSRPDIPHLAGRGNQGCFRMNASAQQKGFQGRYVDQDIAQGTKKHPTAPTNHLPAILNNAKAGRANFHSDNRHYIFLPASGKNNGWPNLSFPNSPINFCVSGEVMKSTNALAPSALTLLNFSGFTSIT